jgi:hypothetical protein
MEVRAAARLAGNGGSGRTGRRREKQFAWLAGNGGIGTDRPSAGEAVRRLVRCER